MSVFRTLRGFRHGQKEAHGRRDHQQAQEGGGSHRWGSTVAEAARRIGVSEQTFYRWRAEYGGLRVVQARRLKQPETEHSWLKRAVVELILDNQILKEAAEGNF